METERNRRAEWERSNGLARNVGVFSDQVPAADKAVCHRTPKSTHTQGGEVRMMLGRFVGLCPFARNALEARDTAIAPHDILWLRCRRAREPPRLHTEESNRKQSKKSADTRLTRSCSLAYPTPATSRPMQPIQEEFAEAWSGRRFTAADDRL